MEPKILIFFPLLLTLTLGNATRERNISTSSIFDFSKVITIDDILNAIRSNKTDCQQITRLFLARIRLYNARLGAVTILNYKGSLADARRLDSYRKRKNGQLFGRLHCVPTLIKDNILVAGMPTTLGLRMFVNSTSRVDAASVWRLKSEGALILGKANLTPFSFGLKAPDEASEIGGQCRNPYGVPSGRGTSAYGSSCGNAVGQAAGLAVIGLATDTAGSITWPASVCGLIGVRPLSKIYSTDGVFPLLKNAGDTIAPIASTVSDAALILDILSISNNSAKNQLSTFSNRRPDGKPYRLGVIKDLAYTPITSPINITRVDGSSYEYGVDEEIFSKTVQFLNLLQNTQNIIIVNLTITSDEFIQLINRLHRVWIDVFACTPQWIDGFFKKYPFQIKKQNSPFEIRSLNDLLNSDSIAEHYRRFFQLFSSHRSQCLPSLRRLRKARTTAKRHLQKRVFDLDDVDVIGFPRPHLLANTASATDTFTVLDPAGALGFPGITVPTGYGGMKANKKRHVISPIGFYMVTRPRKFKAMLDIARLYEKAKPKNMFETNLPPEFV